MTMTSHAISSDDPVNELLAMIGDARKLADELGLGMVAIYLNDAFVRCEEEARKLTKDSAD
jgi:hypothetical protein